jgi:hypothetical protein
MLVEGDVEVMEDCVGLASCGMPSQSVANRKLRAGSQALEPAGSERMVDHIKGV